MRKQQHLDHAVQIAAEAHDGQLDKTGKPYIDHCRRVAARILDDDQRVVAYLHDVVEKADGWTLDRLKEEGFPQAVVAAIDALTRRPGEDDDAFVRRAIAHPLAREVKKADLEDNLLQAEEMGLETSKYERGLRTIAKGTTELENDL